MKYIHLPGKQLKSGDVIDVLECGDLDVIYSFDRLHENQPDQYWVASGAQGVQMCFNGEQTWDTLFFHIEPDEGFPPCKPGSLGVPVFDSRDSAGDCAAQPGLQTVEGGVDFWARTGSGSGSILVRIRIIPNFAAVSSTA